MSFQNPFFILRFLWICPLALLLSCGTKPQKTNHARPNILLIMADDLGYSDLGCYGSEIRTPNIDALAKNGVLNTNFYTASTCSPTRAMLLSGVVAHRNGYGTMEGDWAENQKGLKGYEGYLNFDVVPFPKLLQQGGYHTSIAGKWHQGGEPSLLPHKRGFDRSFILLQGGGGHFFDKQPLLEPIKNSTYFQDSQEVDSLPHNFYSTEFYVDQSIHFIKESKTLNKPFFHFLSFTAPHWPLQVPDKALDLYKDQYNEGYEALAKTRFEKAKKLGIIPKNAQLPPLLPNVKPWSKLTLNEKKVARKTMEIYAAMIELIDLQVGRLLDFLKKEELYDNTLIVFMADNGAEGNSILGYINTEEWVKKTFDNSLENMGRINSYIQLDAAWAQVSALPFKWYKAFSYEGGVRVPAIFSFPKQIKPKNAFNGDLLTVLDIAPTFLEIANIQHPVTKFEGKTIYPLDGSSMWLWLTGKTDHVHPKEKAYAWELFGRIGVRQGNWKAVKAEQPYSLGAWELYNLEEDISEQHDLASKNPRKLEEMIAYWKSYEKKYAVTLPNKPTAYATEKYWKK
jgi:arylsulfatase A-like enzyme